MLLFDALRPHAWPNGIQRHHPGDDKDSDLQVKSEWSDTNYPRTIYPFRFKNFLSRFPNFTAGLGNFPAVSS